ncbi:hypothetical protein TNCV_1093501 [Trichonephila clavipes]|nr:hypothetical protein TNCV_1093501 [Trichonephila clavipes]
MELKMKREAQLAHTFRRPWTLTRFVLQKNTRRVLLNNLFFAFFMAQHNTLMLREDSYSLDKATRNFCHYPKLKSPSKKGLDFHPEKPSQRTSCSSSQRGVSTGADPLREMYENVGG